MLERVSRILEYPRIIEQLISQAASALGKEKIEQLQPSFDYDTVVQAQQATFEGSTILRLKGFVPFGGVRDIRAGIKRSVIGGTLSVSNLLDIASTIYGGRQLKTFLEKIFEDTHLPHVAHWSDQISSLKPLEQAITACIDDHGSVVDSASPALSQIRAQIRSAESLIKEKLNQLTRSANHQKMLQESIVTVRNGRYCLPVKQEYRAHFGGIVHDQSASGATLFIEPGSVVNINNQLREAQLKEEKEIERILTELSIQVAETADSLLRNVKALTELDVIFAKAKYGTTIRGVQPKLNDEGFFNLKQARHPLIPAEEVVPVSFELGRQYTSLIITGPNTGGKTVTLKTLGLLTLMACSGLPIPADEATEVAVVSSVYADIGDEQSIEQSLSTFSSHMTNIIKILSTLDHQSLVLFDELGAGTDPTEGAALAMSILDYVHQTGARVMATTHYSELKAYAFNHDSVMNASVEFDIETLRPTYRLIVGVPGRSNAFAIAKRLGLPKEIIQHARLHIGEEDSKVENMIASLEENKKRAELDRIEAAALKREVEILKRKLQEQQDSFEREKNKRVQQAEEKAKMHFERLLAEAEQVIQDLRQKSSTQAIKEHELIEAQKKMDLLNQETHLHSKQAAKSNKRKVTQPIKPGDEVFVHSFGQKGHVVEQVSDNEYQVQIGILKMKVNVEQLEKLKQEQPKQQTPRASIKTVSEPAKMEVDLRGQTIDEAIMVLDKYLDDAAISNYHQVYIIHGKGTGQLRKGVQDYLKKHRGVKSMRLGGAGEGGSGVTVVEMN